MKITRFSRSGLLFLWVSVALIAAGGAYSYYQEGFNLGIDFSSGISLQVGISGSTSEEEVRSALSQYGTVSVQRGRGAGGRYIIKISETNQDSSFQREVPQQALASLRAQYGAENVQLLESTFIGPRFSANIVRQFFVLTLGAFLLIMLYVWFRFRFSYAIAALAALVHDVLFMVAFVGAFQIEISTTTIAAILTIIGYSLNDTIVIFDRIRENHQLLHEAPLDTIINTSITQSLSRTIMTSLTTLLAVMAIYIFASGPIQYFALNMIVGIVVGTFSSIFIASALLLKLLRRRAAAPKEPTKEVERAISAAPELSAPQVKPKERGDTAQSATLSRAHIERQIETRRKMVVAKQQQRKNKRKRR